MAWHLSLSLGASQCLSLPASILPAPLFACLPIFLDCVKDAAGAGAGAGRPLQICVFLKFIEFRTQKETENQRENEKKTRKMNAKNERKTEPMNSKRASCIHGVACHTPHASVHGLRLRDIQTQSTKRKKELDAYIERLDFEKDLSVTVNVENRCQFLISFPHMRCDRQFNPLNFIRNDDSTQYQHHSLNCLTHTHTDTAWPNPSVNS